MMPEQKTRQRPPAPADTPDTVAPDTATPDTATPDTGDCPEEIDCNGSDDDCDGHVDEGSYNIFQGNDSLPASEVSAFRSSLLYVLGRVVIADNGL